MRWFLQVNLYPSYLRNTVKFSFSSLVPIFAVTQIVYNVRHLFFTQVMKHYCCQTTLDLQQTNVFLWCSIFPNWWAGTNSRKLFSQILIYIQSIMNFHGIIFRGLIWSVKIAKNKSMRRNNINSILDANFEQIQLAMILFHFSQEELYFRMWGYCIY